MSNGDVEMKPAEGETQDGSTTAANNGVNKGGHSGKKGGRKGKFFGNNRRFQPYGGGGYYNDRFYGNFSNFGGYGGYGAGYGRYQNFGGNPYGGGFGGFGGGFGGFRSGKGGGWNLSKQAKNRKYKEQIFKLKDIYELSRKNKFINEDEHFLAVFLKNVFQNIAKEEDGEDIPCILRFLIRHPNIVKCLRYEVKKYVDKIYGGGTDEETLKKKKEVLTEQKEKFLKGYKNDYIPKFKKEFKENYEELLNETVDILTGEKYNPSEHLAKPEDYVLDSTKTQNDFITEFKMHFVKFCYESLHLRVIEALSFTRNTEKRLKFHVENKFIPHLMVDFIKEGKKVPKLQEYCAQFVRPIQQHFYEKAHKGDDLIYKKACEQNIKIETNINNCISLKDNLSAEQFRNLADCLIEFDRHFTINKYKLLHFTPYVNIPDKLKVKLFDEMKKNIYADVINIIKNNINSNDRTYVDMEKDPDYDPNKKQNEDDEQGKEVNQA